MNRTVISITRFVGVLVAVAAAAGCEAEKSRNPLSPNVAGPIGGVSITAPAPISPANGTEVVNTEPLRLVFGNASSNSERPFWYVVELATDPGFNQRVYTNPKVTPASGQQTTLVVESQLTAESTYFWRVKADDGANASDFSSAAHFDLVVPVIIDPPTPVSPVNGQTAASNTPELVVANGRVQGRVGTVEYKFEIARDQGFGDVVSVAFAPRSGSDRTTHQAAALPAGTLLYWRATGTNGRMTSAPSVVQSFRTPTPAPPPGGGGGGGGGGGTPVGWSNDQWRDYVFGLIAQKGLGPRVTYEALAAMRPDIVARGADWQNGWRGDYRPRIFLPVANCPPASRPDAPACAYDRAVDLGDWGGPWQWIPR